MASERKRVDFLTLLPDDLLEKIVLALPVESLVCLASTCKKWRDYLLDDDDFARLHLDQWRSRYGILYSSGGLYPNLVYSPIFDGDTNEEAISARLEDCFSRIRSHFMLKGDKRIDIRVVDSCDGLLLIVLESCSFLDYSTSRCRLVVCNPLMKSFKLLQLMDNNNVVLNCHWKMVYDASIKRYKIIGITIEKVITSMKDGVIISRGREFYILELSGSGSGLGSEWKEVCVCDDELGGVDFGGQVERSLLVVEGEKKKLYYLNCKLDSLLGRQIVETSLIYMDIETDQVKAVAYPSLSLCRSLTSELWVGSSSSSSTGRFYLSSRYHICEVFYLFVLEDVQNPIWTRRCIDGRNRPIHCIGFIQPLEVVVQDDGEDEEGKILYAIDDKIYEYQTGSRGRRGLWSVVCNDTGYHFTHLRQYWRRHFSVRHLHSLIII